MKENFYVGQIFEDMYPVDAANWCNEYQKKMVEIDPINKNVEEEYEDIEEVVVPETEVDSEIIPEHTERQPVTKTRTVNKTLRRFQIQEIPEPSVEEKKTTIRSTRDMYLNSIEWRVSRYRDQLEIGVDTTDTEETYIKILQYMQYLRDYPSSSETWYEENPKTFEEYCEYVD